MSDAIGLFGLALALFGLGFVFTVVGRVWLKSRELEHTETQSVRAASAADILAMLAQVEARLGRLEQAADATAIEVERIAEAQRFAARRLVSVDADAMTHRPS